VTAGPRAASLPGWPPAAVLTPVGGGAH